MELLPGKYNMMVNLYRHTLSYPVSTTISSKWPVPLEFACERGHAYFIDYQVSDHSTFWSTKKSWNPNIKDVTSDYMGSSLKGERDIHVIKQMEMKNELTETNKKKGEEFLANNRYKEGVITLPSGLQYKVINTGKGKIPNLTDTVEVHYRGTLINGTEFDSSYKRGQMANFTVNRVIPGWVEALLKMREGDKWRLFVPSHLAYGERGAGRAIEPNAVLIFEVELITVK